MSQFAHIIQQNLNRGITTSPDVHSYIQQKLIGGSGVIAALQEPQIS